MGTKFGLDSSRLIQLDKLSVDGHLYRMLAVGDDQDVVGMRQWAEQPGVKRCGKWVLVQWRQARMRRWHVELP
jgi:hypothetical protein